MLDISKYNIYIFDCDGVILDSNELKIEAMRRALLSINLNNDLVNECESYFKNNFGLSRFHHVDYFINNILKSKIVNYRLLNIKEQILKCYSEQCEILYKQADLTTGFLDFIKKSKKKHYVASGSEQMELQKIFSYKNLSQFFKKILGSPTPKSQIIYKIISKENSTKAVMFGDSIADLEAARENGIDFIFVSEYSNVSSKMEQLCKLYSFHKIYNFGDL